MPGTRAAQPALQDNDRERPIPTTHTVATAQNIGRPVRGLTEDAVPVRQEQCGSDHAVPDLHVGDERDEFPGRARLPDR